jgi:uncharacterized protein YprB with RNaseH-like and TPR domain
MSKETSEYCTSRSVVSYNGKKKDFPFSEEKWWLAKVEPKGYKEVILGSVPIAKHSDLMEEKLRI